MAACLNLFSNHWLLFQTASFPFVKTRFALVQNLNLVSLLQVFLPLAAQPEEVPARAEGHPAHFSPFRSARHSSSDRGERQWPDQQDAIFPTGCHLMSRSPDELLRKSLDTHCYLANCSGGTKPAPVSQHSTKFLWCTQYFVPNLSTLARPQPSISSPVGQFSDLQQH